MGAASAAAAGEVGRRDRLQDPIGLQARRRPARRDRRARRRRAPAGTRPGAPRRHRFGQDLYDGQGDRGDAASGSHPRSQQDPRRAALWRVQILLSGQRRRVLRLLLRLLPARSLRAALGHLHREGILDQRADRPHAPFGDARTPRTRRRDHRRVGLVHLRYRIGRDLHGDDVFREGRRKDRAAAAHRRSRRAAVQAHSKRLRARHVPGSRRRHRTLPGALGRSRLAHRPLRRRGRIDRRVRPAHRQEIERSFLREDLRQLALRDPAADAPAGDQGHPRRAAFPTSRN